MAAPSSEELNNDIMDEDDVEYKTFGNTNVVVRKSELTPDLDEELKCIFDTTYTTNIENLCTYESYSWFDIGKPNTLEKLLDMPRLLPQDHDFSDNVLLVMENPRHSIVMVFVIDFCSKTKRVSLFHVFTEQCKHRAPFFGTAGYALNDQILYFVGGCFVEHNLLYYVDDIVQSLEFIKTRHGVTDLNDIPKHLNVPAYNLRTRNWENENDTTHLNGPKPYPIVFVYNGKIFALIRRLPDTILEFSPMFEVLDTKTLSRGWTTLPDPPFDMNYFSHHILHEEKGILFFFFLPFMPCNGSSFSGFDDDDDPDPNRPCYELNLNQEKLEWRLTTTNSKSYPASRGFTNLSASESLTGCIVDGIFFYYVHKPDSLPVIRGHAVGGDEITSGPWVIHLEKFLKGKIAFSTSSGFLKHIKDRMFCLVVEYMTGSTDAIFFFTFELVKNWGGHHRSIKKPDATKAQKAEKFDFSLKPICSRAFQLPSSFCLQFCEMIGRECD